MNIKQTLLSMLLESLSLEYIKIRIYFFFHLIISLINVVTFVNYFTSAENI